MCNVCWVNDHMYCRNMKRVAHELPRFCGCIHYIACEHYQPSSMSDHSKSMSLCWTNQRCSEKMPPSHGVVSAEDLLCDEDMLDSESDVSVDSTDATELLQIHLKSRADQIYRSLGVSELPRCKSPVMSTVPESTVVADDDDVVLTPEDYAAEIVVSADGNCVQDLSGIHLSSEAAVETFIAGGQIGEKLVEEEQHWSGNSDHVSSSMCLQASFDGTSPHEPPTNVKVHVCQVSDNRVVIKYPKYHSNPTDYVHLDVTFPNGATDEVVNSYVKNDVARFIREKKSDFSSYSPVSVTVVKDHKSSETTDSEPCVSVIASQRNGLQSPVNTVSSNFVAAESVQLID